MTFRFSDDQKYFIPPAIVMKVTQQNESPVYITDTHKFDTWFHERLSDLLDDYGNGVRRIHKAINDATARF